MRIQKILVENNIEMSSRSTTFVQPIDVATTRKRCVEVKGLDSITDLASDKLCSQNNSRGDAAGLEICSQAG